MSPGIRKRGAHPMRCGRFADRADRPISGNPFSQGMYQNRGGPDNAGGLINRGGLHGCDLMLAQSIAHNIQTAGKRTNSAMKS
jgi:hypothetical protein